MVITTPQPVLAPTAGHCAESGATAQANVPAKMTSIISFRIAFFLSIFNGLACPLDQAQSLVITTEPTCGDEPQHVAPSAEMLPPESVARHEDWRAALFPGSNSSRR